MLEVFRENGSCELLALNYDKTVAVFSPSSDVLVGGILQHAEKFANKFAGIVAAAGSGRYLGS